MGILPWAVLATHRLLGRAGGDNADGPCGLLLPVRCDSPRSLVPASSRALNLISYDGSFLPCRRLDCPRACLARPTETVALLPRPDLEISPTTPSRRPAT